MKKRLVLLWVMLSSLLLFGCGKVVDDSDDFASENALELASEALSVLEGNPEELTLGDFQIIEAFG